MKGELISKDLSTILVPRKLDATLKLHEFRLVAAFRDIKEDSPCTMETARDIWEARLEFFSFCLVSMR